MHAFRSDAQSRGCLKWYSNLDFSKNQRFDWIYMQSMASAKMLCCNRMLLQYSSTRLKQTLPECRGLFERHKLLLSLQMCVRILESNHQVNSEEWQFFLKGGQVLDRSQQPPNPGSAWMSGLAWDNITQLDELPNFKVSPTPIPFPRPHPLEG